MLPRSRFNLPAVPDVRAWRGFRGKRLRTAKGCRPDRGFSPYPNHYPARKNRPWAILAPRFAATPHQSVRRAGCPGLAGTLREASEDCQGMPAGSGICSYPNPYPTRKNQSWAILAPRFPGIPLPSARRTAYSGLTGIHGIVQTTGRFAARTTPPGPARRQGLMPFEGPKHLRGIKTPHSRHGSTCTRY